MKSRLLKGQSDNKGFIFCRVLILIGISSLLVFPLAFVLFIPGSVEIWWDRAFMLFASVFVLLYSYNPKVSLKTHYLNYYILSCVFSVHTLINTYFNNFEQNHFFVFLLIFTSVGLSFRYLKGGIVYIISLLLATAVFLLLADIGWSIRAQLFSWMLLFGSMLYTLLLNKSLFVRHVKVKGELLRAIASKTEDAILLTTMDGFVIDHNDQAVDVLGYSGEELLKLDFNSFRQAELTDEEIHIGLKMLREDKFWKDEVYLKRKDGSHFIGKVTITLISKFSKEYLVFRISDITQSKNAEAELIRAKNEAEEATKAKSEFLATMSHEIRTPMNGVVGMATVLMNSELSPEQLLQVRTIKRSGENLMVILNDILDVSKVESGKMLLEEHDFDFRDMVDEVHHLLSVEAERKKIDFSVAVSTKVPQIIVADSMRLRQVLVNLISNAIKFTEEGSVRLEVESEGDSGISRGLIFKLTDTGIGIPKENLDNLFESFTQVDTSTTRKYGGTGLGLAISKRLVELMDGEIKVESELGKGTCFTFDIAIKEVTPEIAVELQQQEKTPRDVQQLNELRILVAEDNLINRQVINLMLQSLNAKADFVTTGKEALAICQRKYFDIILMDVQMPEMDGLKATKIILEEIQSSAYIIAMTANVLSEDREDCLRVGMKDFLTKPIMIDALQQKLEAGLQQKKQLEKRA